MTKVMLDPDQVDELTRRHDVLMKQTLQLYDGAWLTNEQINQRELTALSNGCTAAMLACIGFAVLVCGICALVIWLLQGRTP